MGELIKKVNISRRTLHYYDEINLLKPTIVKENGYRYYSKDDIIKLQTIVALKSMDYSLQQIKEIFDKGNVQTQSQEDAWLHSLQEQIDFASKKIDALQRKQFILRSMSQVIDISGHYNEDHIFQLIKRLDSPDFADGEIPATFPADYFNEQEITILKQLPLVGSDDPRIQIAIQFVKETRKKMYLPPHSPQAQELAKKWRDCMSSWFLGNIELQEKYFHFIDSIDQEKQVVLYLDKELISFVDEILTHLKENDKA
ncbi:MerR family transcriptional regulator [Gracilibacillus oryzae]|uniref:MerR family transcriptional regulator n=1 Tax=Gracilibacillus oryzae TaxID=1672701 RepID=UPI001D188D8D|nr:MerR family transcriptional regulator [Gracilibacillus oryzae]